MNGCNSIRQRFKRCLGRYHIQPNQAFLIVVVVDVVKCLTFYSLSGTLVSEFLKRDCNQTPQDYCQSVLFNAHLYSGFNLVTARIKYWDM